MEKTLDKLIPFSGNNFFVISVYNRSKIELKENLKKHKDLIDEIFSRGLKSFEIVGEWIRSEYKVEDRYLFIPYNDLITPKGFHSYGLSLMKRYDQKLLILRTDFTKVNRVEIINRYEEVVFSSMRWSFENIEKTITTIYKGTIPGIFKFRKVIF